MALPSPTQSSTAPPPTQIPRQPRLPLDTNARGWLLLDNNGSDCFLNAAVQLLRRHFPIRTMLISFTFPSQAQVSSPINEALRCLAVLLSESGTRSSSDLRAALPTAIPSLDRNFMSAQQDASEIIQAILQILPNDARNPMMITTMHQLRCAGKPVEACPWVG